METHGLERILKRNQFYWDNYCHIALVVVFQLILIVVLVGFVFYQRVAWPTPKYFATTPDGRLLPIIRLDKPVYTDPKLVSDWAVKAVIDTYSMDFVTWRQRLQDAQQYFTLGGYREFIQALKASTNLEAIKEMRQVVSIDIEEEPILSREGQVNQNLPYSWDFRIPVLITYENARDLVIKQKGVVLIRVERASFRTYTKGLAIKQLVLQAV